jgi:Ca2+-binding RTX toxin-like protein
MATFNGTAGNDTLPPPGADNSGDDQFFGLAGNDTLAAGNGNDTITGGTGNDTVTGGAGNDRNIWNNGDNTDTFDGGDGLDVQEVNGAAAGDVFTLSNNGGVALFSRTNLVPFDVGMTNVERLEVRSLDGDDSFTIGNLTGTSLATGTLFFDGGLGNDTLDASASTTAITGLGGAGEDTLRGGSGNDTITGGTGNDTVTGGAGNDRNIWNNGDNTDTFDGGDGLDVQEVNGAAAGDVFTLSNNGGVALFSRTNLVPFDVGMTNVERLEVRSLDGDDSFTIGNLTGTSLATGTLFFDGGLGNDTFNASASTTAVTALGGAGTDNMVGSGVADTLDGGADADRIAGGLGNDGLSGGDGNDILIGGRGKDILDGDGGADVFDFNSKSDSLKGSLKDTVFFGAGDTIDLGTIDAAKGRGFNGNQDFEWVDDDNLGAKFTGEAGELRFSKGVLSGDINGDGVADFEIKIVGSLTAEDVIL